MTINSLLIEMSGPSKVLYHFTNLEGLFGILKNKFIKGQDYEVGLHTDRKTERRSEVATVRPSMAKHSELKDLSDSIGEVRIDLIINKLNDIVRGVRARPIAELPLKYINIIKNFLLANTSTKYYVAEKQAKDLYKFVVKEVLKNDKNISQEEVIKLSKSTEEKGKVIFFIKKMFGLGSFYITEEDFYNFLEAVSLAYYFMLNREGEERISIKDKNIPLNPKYIKINLLSGFFEENKERIMKRKREFFKLIDDNKSLFVMNEEFQNLYSMLFELLRIKDDNK